LGAGRTSEELAAFLKTGTYADARPGGWDPAQRLPDMELDGVEAEKRKIIRENAARLYGFDLG
jgi:predicted TIM-barrel fold metal-dependent hydrolase